MGDTLLKRWNNWEDGIGYVIDDGERNGLYKASGLLGLRGELRVAPFKNTVTVAADAAHHYQYYFEEPLAAQLPVFDTAASGSTVVGLTVTVSITVANQSNRVLLIWVHTDVTGT